MLSSIQRLAPVAESLTSICPRVWSSNPGIHVEQERVWLQRREFVFHKHSTELRRLWNIFERPPPAIAPN